MIVRFVLVWSVLVVFCSPAATLTLNSLTIGPTTYSNVTVLGANTTDLYFKHEHGIANVKLKYLSPALQKRFGYDPKAAAEEEKRQSEMDVLYQKQLEMNLEAEAASAQEANRKRQLSSEDSLADPISAKSLVGKRAPALNFEKWLGDKPALEAKSVLLAFWAPWSYPSRKCIPNWNGLQKKFPDKLVVVGVCSESEKEIADMPGPKPEFAAALDPKGKLAALLAVTSVPCVLLLDPKGIVQYQGHPAAITDAKLEALLTRAAD
jgi:cytochrome c biogenesis protein CcmG, thiol:disulfide interchange protein DsbE